MGMPSLQDNAASVWKFLDTLQNILNAWVDDLYRAVRQQIRHKKYFRTSVRLWLTADGLRSPPDVNSLLVTGSNVSRDSSAEALAISSSGTSAAVPNTVAIVAVDADDAVTLVECRAAKDLAGVRRPVLPLGTGRTRWVRIGRHWTRLSCSPAVGERNGRRFDLATASGEVVVCKAVKVSAQTADFPAEAWVKRQIHAHRSIPLNSDAYKQSFSLPKCSTASLTLELGNDDPVPCVLKV